MKEKIINYASGLAALQKLVAEPDRLVKEITDRYLQKKQEMLDMIKEFSSNEELGNLLLNCPDQASYETLASAMEEVLGPARVIDIEAGIF